MKNVRCLLTLGVVLGLGCDQKGKGEKEIETSAPVPVTVEAVTLGSVESTTFATGLVAPAPGADLVVTSPQSGRLERLPKSEGDRVQPGDILAVFDIPALRAEVASREGEVVQAKARVANAQAAQKRLGGLFDRGIAARKELEDADRDAAESQAALFQAEAQKKASLEMAQRMEVKAPFAGQVVKRWHNPGDLVDGGAADPVIRLVDPRRLEVVIAAPGSAARRVAVNQVVRIFLPDEAPETPPCPGRILGAPGATDPASGSAPVRASFQCPLKAQVGTPVRVEMILGACRKCLNVPVGAVVREGEKSFVYMVNAKGLAERRAVEVGFASSEAVEIRKGLVEGDRIIVEGHEGLPEGAAVAEHKPAPAETEK